MDYYLHSTRMNFIPLLSRRVFASTAATIMCGFKNTRRLLCFGLLIGLGPASTFAGDQSRNGTDGLYATTENNYRIEVRFEPGKLIVVEPNKTSDYIQRPNSAIYDFKNPTNGIVYVLEVADGGKALKAYKPGTPENVTALKLVRPATPVAEVATPAAERIPVQNPKALNPDLEELWGVRKIEGIRLDGQYSEGASGPYIKLAADGTGVFEMYGAPKPEHVYKINWWIQANRDGTLVKTDHAAAAAYLLIVEYVDKPYQGEKFGLLRLAVQKADDGRIYILDRSKPKTNR